MAILMIKYVQEEPIQGRSCGAVVQRPLKGSWCEGAPLQSEEPRVSYLRGPRLEPEDTLLPSALASMAWQVSYRGSHDLN